MRKFVTAAKVDAEVHGGAFLWESFRLVLTISDDGQVTYQKEPISPNPGSPLTLTGYVTPTDRNSWFEIHIFREDCAEKIILYALESCGSLVCSIYSEFNQSSKSELFYREEGQTDVRCAPVA
jgi:hypothetical protein